MQEKDLIEPIGVKETFVDYFTSHVSMDGVMRCVGVRKINGDQIVVIRLAWPVVNTECAIEEAQSALAAPAPATVNKGPPKQVH